MTAFRWTQTQKKSNFRTTVKYKALYDGVAEGSSISQQGELPAWLHTHCWLWVHCDARDDVCSCVKANRDVHADTSSSSFQWATAVNSCKTRMQPLDSGNCLEISIGLFPQCIWVGLCIYCVFGVTRLEWWAVHHTALHWETWEISTSEGWEHWKETAGFLWANRKQITCCFSPYCHHIYLSPVSHCQDHRHAHLYTVSILHCCVCNHRKVRLSTHICLLI